MYKKGFLFNVVEIIILMNSKLEPAGKKAREIDLKPRN